MKKQPIPVLLSCLGVWLLYTVYLVLSGTRLPGTDVFIFKEAGVNLGLTGRFVVSNLPYMPVNTDFTYYFYSPFYPFIYGVWTKITGFGYSQGILFDALIRLMRTLLLVVFLWKPLKAGNKFSSSCVCVLLLLLTFVTSDADRPDDLAALFGLASWYFLFQTGIKNQVLSGIFLGLVAGTSPAGAVFFTLGTMAYSWPWLKNFKALSTVGFSSLVIFLMVIGPIFFNDPELYSLFSKQAAHSNFSQSYDFQGWEKLGEFLVSWFNRIVACMKIAPPTTIGAGILLFASLWIFKSEKIEKKRKIFFISGSLLFLLLVIVWLLQPYYLWFSTLALFVYVGESALKKNVKAKFILLLLCVSLIPKTFEEAKFFFVALQVPKEETVFAIKPLLESNMPEGVRVAVTPDQFYSIGRNYKVSNIGHVCMHVEDTDYLYITRAINTKTETPIPIPCESRAACFDIVMSTSENRQVNLFGKKLEYFVRSSGGTLYKNTRCLGMNIPWDVRAEDWLKRNGQ